jgi:histidinol-phosphate aminotransferase
VIDLHHHGDAELAPGLLDLAVNVCTDPPPEWLTTAILSACARLAAYPNAHAATLGVAARHGRTTNEVLLTAGAAEAFTLIAQAMPRGRASVVHPQFTEPEVALHAAGWTVDHVVLDERDGYALHPDRVPEDSTLVVVGNPTNPTGTLHARSALRALRRPGRVVVVDEAFLDSLPGEPESLAGADDLTGVLVVRSLTKTWGLAGLRVGYLLGDATLIAECARVQPHWSVSSPALAAAAACSTPAAHDEVHRRAVRLTAVRERLRDDLNARGLRTVEASVGPFLLAVHPQRHDLHAALRTLGIAVRRADTFPGLGEGWIRISVRDDDANEALLDALDHLLNDASRPEPRPGLVTLVGGGPGPAGQITIDGLLALQRADVVVTDRLAPVALIEHLPAHVEVVDAAKNPRGAAMPQEKINRLLVDHALAGRQVVRLKGGDPFVFGRGFEELQACAAAAVRTRVVPGVTSAVAGPAAAGVPVTHRGLTHGFTVVSGHLPPGHPGSLTDWAALARSGTTLVVLMGVATLPSITQVLIEAGLPAPTPAAIVVDAGQATQRTLHSTLGELARDAGNATVGPPAVVVIGAVAGLAEQLP